MVGQALAALGAEPPATLASRLRRCQLLALQGLLDGTEPPLRQALEQLRPLEDEAALGRTARLAAAETRAWLADLGVPDADAQRRSAATALREAAAEQPLGPDHRQLLARLPG